MHLTTTTATELLPLIGSRGQVANTSRIGTRTWPSAEHGGQVCPRAQAQASPRRGICRRGRRSSSVTATALPSSSAPSTASSPPALPRARPPPWPPSACRHPRARRAWRAQTCRSSSRPSAVWSTRRVCVPSRPWTCWRLARGEMRRFEHSSGACACGFEAGRCRTSPCHGRNSTPLCSTLCSRPVTAWQHAGSGASLCCTPNPRSRCSQPQLAARHSRLNGAQGRLGTRWGRH
mmetsp:Transcript_127263/g.407309  ORF Transcript_127263/g.407309 Transcript_127263/m.407309 type:complete len:234 (-) Transcript_127263:38-739(-)